MTIDKTIEAIEPCPFCKGEMVPNHDYRDGYENCPDDADAIAYYYRCRSCAATSGWSKSESGAVRYANMRTPELTAELKQLREFVGAIHNCVLADGAFCCEVDDGVWHLTDVHDDLLATGTDPFDAWRKMNAGEANDERI